MMEAVIKKGGSNLALRIPNLIAREFSLKDGSFVEIRDAGNEIVEAVPKLQFWNSNLRFNRKSGL
jgi:antitoxin component of MazEF toxin-antitoxin module